MNKALVIGSGSIAKRHISNLKLLFPAIHVMCVSASGRELKGSEVDAEVVKGTVGSIDLSQIDIAIVASPAPFHLAHAKPLVTAKIPVLIEKPLCAEISELKDSSFLEPKVKVGIGYNLRYMPSARVVKKILSDGMLGKISTVFAEVGQYLPDWRPGVDYTTGVSARKILGGGALLELSHELDYLNWLFGNFQKVCAKIRNSNLLDIDVEDSVDALLMNDSDTLFHVHLDFLQRKPTRSLRILGENGSMKWDLLSNQVIFNGADGSSNAMYSDPDYNRNDMYLDQLHTFIESANLNTKFESDVTSATDVMRLVEAIRVSDRAESWVKIEDFV